MCMSMTLTVNIQVTVRSFMPNSIVLHLYIYMVDKQLHTIFYVCLFICCLFVRLFECLFV